MEFEILKTGKFMSSNGQEKEFSQTDLENIASSYDPSVSEAPLVIGHPKTNDPAYGWIENLKVTGDRLIAKAKQVVPEFLEAVKNGLFKKRSVSLTQDGKLRHVGFLGAELPAVKGLKDLAFSETETDTTYEFSDPAAPSVETPQAVVIIENEKPATAVNPSPDPICHSRSLPRTIGESRNLPLDSSDNPDDSANFSDSLKNILDAITEIKTNIEKQNSQPVDPSPTPIPTPTPAPTPSISGTFTDKIDFYFNNGKLTVPMKQKLLELTQTEYNFSEFKLENYLNEFLDLMPSVVPLETVAVKPEKEEIKTHDFSEFLLDPEAELLHEEILSKMSEQKISYKSAAELIFSHKI
ncbi:MAG: hypothetical protein ACYCVH_15385 [Ignavibacteriaceae bacterium]